MAHVHTLPARPGTRVASHRAPLGLDPTDRLQLLLALCCALTGTPWGAAMAAVVVAVLLGRRRARRTVVRSVAARRRVLATAQRPDLLHATGQHRQAVAGP